MKVLHLLSSNKYSGAENVACQIISLFNDEKNDFAYCSPDGEIKESVENRNIKFIPLKKMSVKEIKRVIKEFNPDIIHAHDARAISLVCLAQNKIPVIAHVHNNRPDFKKRTILSLIFSHFAKKKIIKKIIWVSQSCFEDFYNCKNKKISDKSIVINNIIDQEQLYNFAKNADCRNGTELVYIGRFSEQKAPLRMINIFSKLKQKLPNIKFSMIGDGDLLCDCKQKAKELGVEDDITFYGFLKNGYGVLKNSKIFLMSSVFEGNPIAVLEAQTFGLPVVITEIDEVKTTVKENQTGFMYKIDDEASDILEKLLTDKKLYERISKATVEFSNEYNDKQTYKNKLFEIYSLSLNPLFKEKL